MLKAPLMILFVGWALCTAGVVLEYRNRTDNPIAMGILFGLAGAGLLAARAAGRSRTGWPRMRARLEDHTARVDLMSERYDWLWVALAAGLGLYLELVVVRYHASCFQLFAFFKNFSLLSCFLGLGIGYAIAHRGPLFTPLVLPMLACQMVFLHALRFTDAGELLQNPVSEFLAMGMSEPGLWFHAATVYGFLILVFCFNALCFVPLGQLAGRTMRRPPRLVAYGWNLVGSLAGIALFFAVSSLWQPPVVWVGLGVLGLLPFLSGPHRLASAIAAVIVLATLGTNIRTDQYDVYSPYQVLSVHLDRDPYPEIRVNHDYYQEIWNFSATGSGRSGIPLRAASRHYALPYAIKPRPADVLVVGSGTGNDVASAVRHGAGHVDAVEIDPAILALGRQLHPEQPYARENVTPIVDDARAFLRRTNKKYDLIVYGLLDSHTLLSGMGSVRLDSYVYTVNAFREARARLKPGGVIVLSFSMLKAELGRKLYLMLTEAFGGTPPTVYQTGYDVGVAFVIGEGVPKLAVNSAAPDLPFGADLEGLEEVTATYADAQLVADPSTDDWPFFYMPVRKYPVSYAVMIVALLAVAFVFVRALVGRGEGEAFASDAGPGTGALGGFSPPCFLLGAGFMLLETKAITELALFYGSTWVVVGVVIAAILIMAFLANLLLIRAGSVSPAVAYGLLLLSLAVSLVFAYGYGPSPSGPLGGRATRTVVITLPLFFAGLAFSTELKRSKSVGAALSSNLLGAMLGGCLEYNALYFGYRSLYVLAMVIYALAFFTSIRPRPVREPVVATVSASADGAA